MSNNLNKINQEISSLNKELEKVMNSLDEIRTKSCTKAFLAFSILPIKPKESFFEAFTTVRPFPFYSIIPFQFNTHKSFLFFDVAWQFYLISKKSTS